MRGRITVWRQTAFAFVLAAVATSGGTEAWSSIPISIMHLRCLQPATFTYAASPPSSADLAQDAVALEELLAKAGLPEPLVEMHDGRASISTYAASQPDAERLAQLIDRELALLDPGCRSLKEPEFVVSEDYAPQAMKVISLRLKLAGCEGQSGLLAPNRLWVSVHGTAADLQWVWQRRGLFEERLLPGDVQVGFNRLTNSDRSWQPDASRRFQPLNLPLLLKRAPLVVSNRPPILETSVWQVPDHPRYVVTATLAPSEDVRLKEMTAKAGHYTLAFVWDGRVIDGLTWDGPFEDTRISSGDFEGEAGRREAERFAVCLESGPLPTLLTAEPPKPEIPESITAFLQSTYPEWRLMSYDDYGPALWPVRLAEFTQRHGPRYPYPPFALSDDFDGNGKPDWAVLLKKGAKVRLIGLHHAGTTWEPHLVTEFPYDMGFQTGASGFACYLETMHEHSFLRRNWDLGRLADVPGNGFELVLPGRAAWLWKWDGKQYLRFLAADEQPAPR